LLQEPGDGTLVEVPPLVGQTPEEARETAGSLGLNLEGSSSAANDIVLSQEPQSGEEVEEGADISVTFGDDDGTLVKVPDVVGRSRDEAFEAAETEGLLISNTRFDPGASAPRGEIVSQTPTAGSLTGRDSPLSITISGRE
ncbi:MAG: PASTA domain-containing protein, partial [Rubrobacteraceae bacterium]